MNERIIVNRHIKSRRAHTESEAPFRARVALTNGVLMLVAVMSLAYYIVQANQLSAMNFNIRKSSELVTELREKSHAVGAQIAEYEHPDRLVEFARGQGMVLAADASYVAAQPGLAGR